ncbi:MAG: prolipoprotein diacylglyceryl transferase [Magnetococcales bacterium]|nr:prolipoprotein diacylglyceryl transferase [Magnetococcales bacterium]
MIAYPEIDPIIVSVGPLALRWYGLMYSLAFLLGWPLISWRVKRLHPDWSSEDVADMLVWLLLGIVLGGRLGYVVFYNFSYFIDHPLDIFMVWQGGMSFHGGVIGVLAACVLFSRKRSIPCLELADLVVPVVPLGLFLGRIGNFINGELWGRTTDLPWAMIFPTGGPLPRHPSQLYEAFLEGIFLFTILWIISLKQRVPGVLLGLFLVGYGICRFAVEFVREPDGHIGLLAMDFTLGQWLSLPMIIIGSGLIFWVVKRGSER